MKRTITLKRIINTFRKIAEEHKQINDFGYGDIFELDSKSYTPTILWFDVTNSVVNRNSITYTFTVYVGDLYDHSDNDRVDVQSETMLILNDVITILRREEFIDDSFSYNATPFIQEFSSRLAGWQCQIEITTEAIYGACDLDFEELKQGFFCPSEEEILLPNIYIIRDGIQTYSTLTEAKEDAKPGETIVVNRGIYDEKNLLKNGVNWHFEEGTGVICTQNTSGAIFDDGQFGPDEAVTCRITGKGIFHRDSVHSYGRVLLYLYNGSDIYFEAKKITSMHHTVITNVADLTLRVDEVEFNDPSDIFLYSTQIVDEPLSIDQRGSGKLDVEIGKAIGETGTISVVWYSDADVNLSVKSKERDGGELLNIYDSESNVTISNSIGTYLYPIIDWGGDSAKPTVNIRDSRLAGYYYLTRDIEVSNSIIDSGGSESIFLMDANTPVTVNLTDNSIIRNQVGEGVTINHINEQPIITELSPEDRLVVEGEGGSGLISPILLLNDTFSKYRVEDLLAGNVFGYTEGSAMRSNGWQGNANEFFSIQTGEDPNSRAIDQFKFRGGYPQGNEIVPRVNFDTERHIYATLDFRETHPTSIVRLMTNRLADRYELNRLGYGIEVRGGRVYVITHVGGTSGYQEFDTGYDVPNGDLSSNRGNTVFFVISLVNNHISVSANGVEIYSSGDNAPTGIGNQYPQLSLVVDRTDLQATEDVVLRTYELKLITERW